MAVLYAVAFQIPVLIYCTFFNSYSLFVFLMHIFAPLRHENSRIDGQWLWDHAAQFARWQHLQWRRGARFAMPGTLVV